MSLSKHHDGVLRSLPQAASASSEAGLRGLGLGGARDGQLYLPSLRPEMGCPLIVLLHGAGGDGASMLPVLQDAADEHGCALLLPDARRHTWDFLLSGFGPDVQFLDRALEQVFRTCSIDASRVAVAGFSDGASYALTLGLANGDLFTHAVAFSPGFMHPPRLAGAPRVFVSHGVQDEVLPIQRCSRRIVPQLDSLGYDVTYREFEGPHTVPRAIAEEATLWFLASPRLR